MLKSASLQNCCKFVKVRDLMTVKAKVIAGWEYCIQKKLERYLEKKCL